MCEDVKKEGGRNDEMNGVKMCSVESADGFFFIENISSERRPNFSHHRVRAIS